MTTYSQTLTVIEQYSAISMGSGNLLVYATPSMIAFMENTATKLIEDLDSSYTTVGIEINTKHLKASKIGEILHCTATLIKQEGKLYEFDIVVKNDRDDIVGTATHKRVAVNIEKFMNSF